MKYSRLLDCGTILIDKDNTIIIIMVEKIKRVKKRDDDFNILIYTFKTTYSLDTMKDDTGSMYVAYIQVNHANLHSGTMF